MALRRWAAALVALAVVGCGAPPAPSFVAIGAGPDAESGLVAQLYAAALRYYGSAVGVVTSSDPLSGLDAGAFGVVPGFTGRLLHRFDPGAVARSDEQVYRTMVSALPEGIAAGDYSVSTSDKPALTVTESTAKAFGGRDVTALVRNCAKLTVGTIAGSRQPVTLGACRLPDARQFPDHDALFAALRGGSVNAAWISMAQAGIPADLVVLADRTSLVRAENLVPLYRRNELNDLQVRAINELAGVLDTAALAQMQAAVGQGVDPAAVADEFLAANPLGH